VRSLSSVGGLSQAIHNDPYRVVPTRCAGQTNNEVHTYVLSFLFEDAQGVQISGGPQMIDFDSSTCVTFGHILRYLSLHSCPPETLLQVLIYLVCSQVDRILRAMSLIHDLAVKLKILWNHKSILEP
jgi:hypothetical protein